MIARITLPIVAGDEPGTSLPVAGDIVKLIACQGVCLARISEVVDEIRLDDAVVILDVLAEIEVTGDDPTQNNTA